MSPVTLLLFACNAVSDSAPAWWVEEAAPSPGVAVEGGVAPYLAEVCEGRFDNDGDGVVDEGCTGTCDTFVSREKGDWTLAPCVLNGATDLDLFADGPITVGTRVSLATGNEVRDFLTADIASASIPVVTGSQQFVVVSKLNMRAFATADLVVGDCDGNGVDDTYAECVATLEARLESYGSIPNSLIKDLALVLRDISKLGAALPAPYDETCADAGVEDCNGLDDDGDGVVDDDCACYTGGVATPDEVECNGLDDDGDGSVDEGSVGTTWYPDQDGDGQGDDQVTVTACEPPFPGWAATAGDCYDLDADVFDGAPELCDGKDNDCDGQFEEDASCPCDVVENDDGYGLHPYLYCVGGETFDDASAICQSYGYTLVVVNDATEDAWLDGEIDGRSASPWWLGLADQIVEGQFGWVDGTPPYYTNWHSAEPNDAGPGEDCAAVNFFTDGSWNDADCANTYNYVCEGGTRPLEPFTVFKDADGDTFGDDADTLEVLWTVPGYAVNGGDCDDADANVNPNSLELCDTVDNDCSGEVDDDGVDGGPWYIDNDGDGYGSGSATSTECTQPLGYASTADDCDDAAPDTFPTATEACDGGDGDCDGTIDEAATCPCAWDTYGSSAYLFCTAGETHADAHTECQAWGYGLATINDGGESAFVWAGTSFAFGEWWIGYTDALYEGSFGWISGDGSGYTDWHSGEPNNVADEDCVTMGFFKDATWSDKDCLETHAYVCEAW